MLAGKTALRLAMGGKMMTVRKGILCILIIILLSMNILAGCGGGEPASETEAERIVPVEVVETFRGEVQEVRSYQGTLAPKASVNLVPKMGGKIATVTVQAGDRVEAGEVLVCLETTEIAAQVAQAEAGYQIALLQLDKVKAGTRIEQLEQSRAAYAIAEAQYESAKVNLERMEVLYENSVISKQELEQTETQYKTVAAQLKQASESLKMAEAGATREDIRMAEVQVAQAEASFTLASTQLDNAVNTAPISGTVSAVTAKVGEMASPGMSLATINQLDTLEIQLNLTENNINRVQPEQTVEVMVAAVSSKPLPGKIINISPVADLGTKTFPVKVEVDNENGHLRAGMSARVDVIAEMYQGGIVVPREAIIEQNSEAFLFVINEGVAEKRIVEIGLQNKDLAALISGVAAGEAVVVKGQYYLEQGSNVTVSGGELKDENS